jgi:hypothetical protein
MSRGVAQHSGFGREVGPQVLRCPQVTVAQSRLSVPVSSTTGALSLVAESPVDVEEPPQRYDPG